MKQITHNCLHMQHTRLLGEGPSIEEIQMCFTHAGKPCLWVAKSDMRISGIRFCPFCGIDLWTIRKPAKGF